MCIAHNYFTFISGFLKEVFTSLKKIWSWQKSPSMALIYMTSGQTQTLKALFKINPLWKKKTLFWWKNFSWHLGLVGLRPQNFMLSHFPPPSPPSQLGIFCLSPLKTYHSLRPCWSCDDMTKTSQELRMLSSVTLNCQETKTVMNSGSQWSE